MVIDLETERRSGLDESQLARDVMLLMNMSETCSGLNPDTDIPESAKHLTWQCRECGYHGVYLTPHPRVPKPLREVRDELLAWMLPYTNKFGVEVFYGKQRHTLRISAKAIVLFDAIADEAIALALGAVRLLMEKQDDTK